MTDFHKRCVMGLALALAAASPAAAQAPARDPDWPCVQVYVPDLSPGQVWAGPPLEDVAPRWRDDDTVRRLVAEGTRPGTAAAALEADIAALAEAAGQDRNHALTTLFAGIYEAHAEKRRATLQAIKSYASQQDALHARIAATLATLDTAPPGSREEAAAQDALQWQRRILDDRRRALEAICEQPVLVEQHLGTLARAIGAHLE
jgi:hypothetical protein